MKYPALVRKSQCKTPIKVVIYTGDIGEDGAPEVLKELTALCNYQSKVQTVYTAEKQVLTINGAAYFVGDLVPDVAEILDGEVEVFGMTHKIYRSIKARNEDGSVNFTKLELM